MRLDNQVAIVTGGDKGIGRGITKAFAQHGADVVIANLNEEKAKETIEECEDTGQNFLWVKTDVSKSADVDNLIKQTMNKFGRIDIFVNNAGISSIGKIWEIEEDDFDRILAINTKGVFLCTKAAVPIMIKQGSGNIINIASRAAKVSVKYQGHYGASKAAVLLLTRNFASELAEYGIRVNAICPGKVDTGMIRTEWQEETVLRKKTVDQIIQDIIDITPMGRLLYPEDIAKVAVFLASDYSAALTGQSINVTCGLEMR